jgi:hypothetical protein
MNIILIGKMEILTFSMTVCDDYQVNGNKVAIMIA